MKYIIVHIIDKYQSIAYTYCSYVLMFVLPVNVKNISCFYYHNSSKITKLDHYYTYIQIIAVYSDYCCCTCCLYLWLLKNIFMIISWFNSDWHCRQLPRLVLLLDMMFVLLIVKYLPNTVTSHWDSSRACANESCNGQPGRVTQARVRLSLQVGSDSQAECRSSSPACRWARPGDWVLQQQWQRSRPAATQALTQTWY